MTGLGVIRQVPRETAPEKTVKQGTRVGTGWGLRAVDDGTAAAGF